MYIPKCTAQICFLFCIACFLQVLILCNCYFIIFPTFVSIFAFAFVFRLQTCSVEKQLLSMARLRKCDRKSRRLCKVFNCILCMPCCILCGTLWLTFVFGYSHTCAHLHHLLRCCCFVFSE